MTRNDIVAARDVAARFVELSDDLLLSHRDRFWNHTWEITGKLTGAHRRTSLDLTRALATMRNRFR